MLLCKCLRWCKCMALFSFWFFLFFLYSCLEMCLYVFPSISACLPFFLCSFHLEQQVEERRMRMFACKMDETAGSLFVPLSVFFNIFFFVICVVFFVAVLSCLGTVLEWESFICAQCWSIVISWSLILDHTVCILGQILNFYSNHLYFSAW